MSISILNDLKEIALTEEQQGQCKGGEAAGGIKLGSVDLTLS